MIGGVVSVSRGCGTGTPSRGSGKGSSRGGGRGGTGTSSHGGSSSASSGDDGTYSRGGASGGRGSGRRGGRGGIYGYSDSTRPTLGGDHKCPHCLCTPCVVSTSPSFLEGSAAPGGRNAHKRYPLFRKF